MQLETETTLPANPPKGFRKYASHPEREGIRRLAGEFYYSKSLQFQASEDGRETITTVAGKSLTLYIIETRRGFYFGQIEK